MRYDDTSPEDLPAARPVVPGPVHDVTRFESGLEFSAGAVTFRIEALRDDILRVRGRIGDAWPEDASWAVVDASRERREPVEPSDTANTIGFRTTACELRVSRGSSRIVVLDREGRVACDDAVSWPTTFQNGGFSIFKAIAPKEKFFGLGDKTGLLARNNQSFVLWNTDPENFQESTDPIYKSIPFVLSIRAPSRCSGLLLDNTYRSTFDFGKRHAEVLTFAAEAGALDYYLMVASSPKRVIEAYAYLTGRPPLPPMWVFGHHQSRYGYKTADEVRSVAKRLRDERIPSDCIYLDIDFQDRFRPFTADPRTFAAFPRLIADLEAQNFKTVVIADLHLPIVDDYAPFRSGQDGDHFILNRDGTMFAGEMWAGVSAYPEFTRKLSRDWWGGLFRGFVDDGVAGFWNDMNEPVALGAPQDTIPLETPHRIEEPGFVGRTATHGEIHNIYGMQNSRATYDGVLALRPDRRPFVLTRATYAGGQRYAATWTGDNSATWNHLRLGVAMLLNLGLSGFAFCGADLGGFFGSVSADLLTRWYQIGAFTPLFRNHAFMDTARREPWLDGDVHTAIRRHFVEERYRLMPYIYTLAQEASETGIPMMRPLFLEFPMMAEAKRWYVREPLTQFMFGASLMVAPPPFAEMLDAFAVTLPNTHWYDYWTGLRVPGGGQGPGASTEMLVQPTIETIPLFVRGGSILPRQPLVQSTLEQPEGRLELRIYPDRDCKGSIYLDAGDGFAHTKGVFLKQRFAFTSEGHTMRFDILPRRGRFVPWWTGLSLTIYGIAEEPLGVDCSFGTAANVRFDRDAQSVGLDAPDCPGEGSVVLRFSR